MSGSAKEIEAFLNTLWLEYGLSENTMSAYGSDLNLFDSWLKDSTLIEVGETDISRFLLHRQQQGHSNRSSARMLSSLRRFYGYLLREKRIAEDPTQLIDAPHIGRVLPDSLSEEDVERLLLAPETVHALGFRDRTMLELLYAAGLRVSELVDMTFQQINFRQGCIRRFFRGSSRKLRPFSNFLAI